MCGRVSGRKQDCVSALRQFKCYRRSHRRLAHATLAHRHEKAMSRLFKVVNERQKAAGQLHAQRGIGPGRGNLLRVQIRPY